MKFSPVKIELKPAMKIAVAAVMHVGIEIVGGERGREGPAGINATQHQGQPA